MRKVNLKIQMHNLITQKLAQGVGVSRHAIKQELEQHHKETGELLKDPSIHAITTAKSYRNAINQFSKFLKEKHPDVWNSKDLSNITREISYQFLQERQERGLSAWTVSQELSAINKLLEQDFFQYIRLSSELMNDGFSNVSTTVRHLIPKLFHLFRRIFCFQYLIKIVKFEL